MEEKHLRTTFANELLSHLATAYTMEELNGVNDVRLRCVVPKINRGKSALVVLGGRTEFVEKYAEIFFDLKGLDISLYSYDHRGQGASGRMLDDSHKGHVEKFEDYVEDLKLFLETIVVPQRYENIYILSHSMGGTISTLFQQHYPGRIKAMVLVAPMFSIKTGPLPPGVVKWLANAAIATGFGDSYVLGGTPFREEVVFAGNDLTSSELRFSRNHRLMAQNKELQLGSPTCGWIAQAFSAMERIMKSAEMLEIPILLLQSGDDGVVGAIAHNAFCRLAKNCHLQIIEGARHELLMEQDAMRQQALSAIESFLREEKAFP